mmetsp:Transcript_52356/g.86666  ORF Transcript_52356/g.86666 Transcript_52356/m.86666 type:complete len:179 (+) Transcript_52356:28-564(+)
MSFFGLKCLRKIEILYCHHHKASAGVRDWIYEGHDLYTFAKKNPHVQIVVSMDTGRPPLMIASYIRSTQRQKFHEHMIEISELSKQDISKKIRSMADRTGRNIQKKKWKNTETLNYSLQGRWFPGIWGDKKISHTAVLETHRHVPSLWDYKQLPSPYPLRNVYKARLGRRDRLRRFKL